MESIKRVILIGTLGVLISSLLLAFFAPTAEAADSQVEISIDNKSDYLIKVGTRVLDGPDEEASQKGFGVFKVRPGEFVTPLDITISEGTYEFAFNVDIHDEWYSKYVECKSNKITNVVLVVYPNDAEIVVYYEEKEKGFGGILWVCGAIFIILIIVILCGVWKSRVRKRARGREAGEKREREAQEKTKRAEREERKRRPGERESAPSIPPRHPPSGAPPTVKPPPSPEREEIIKQFKASYLDPECTKRVKFGWLIDEGSLIISKEIITFTGQKTKLQITSISNVTKERVGGSATCHSLVSFDARTKDGKLRKVALGGTSFFRRKWDQITDEIYHTLSEWQPEEVTGAELAPERMRIKCPGCETIFEVTLKERPFEMVCPRCGRKGVMK